MEETVVGYQVYRREVLPSDKKDLPANFNGLSASTAAKKFGFLLIANVPVPFYDDLNRKHEKHISM